MAERRKDKFEIRAEKLAVEVEKIFVELTARLQRDINDAAELDLDTLATLNSYAQALEDSMYDEIFEEFLEIYGDRAEDIRSRLGRATGVPFEYSGADLDVMDAIINTDFEQVTNAINEIGTTVRQEVIRGAVSGAGAQFDTGELSGRLKNNVETEVRTGEMAFNRTVSNTQAVRLGFDKFRYSGVRDGKNRDFCAERIGETFTLEEIERMDNGQGLDVFSFGGGYNCRHIWVPVDGD